MESQWLCEASPSSPPPAPPEDVVPPSRAPTTCRVAKLTPEERELFRAQERERFAQPHKVRFFHFFFVSYHFFFVQLYHILFPFKKIIDYICLLFLYLFPYQEKLMSKFSVSSFSLEFSINGSRNLSLGILDV